MSTQSAQPQQTGRCDTRADGFRQRYQHIKKGIWTKTRNKDRKTRIREGQDRQEQFQAVKHRGGAGKPKAELVKRELADAVDMADACCVIQIQLTQAFEVSQAWGDVLDALATVQP